MKKFIFSIIFLAVLAMSCKKEYRYIYDVGSEVVYESSAEKDKQKLLGKIA